MKKLLILVVCCLCLCGCGKEKLKLSKTYCTLDSRLSDSRTNYYKWILKYNNNKIIEKEWKRSYEYETLSEAIEEEQSYSNECKNKDYYCGITRVNKIVTYHISYECGNNSLNDNDCDYLKEIKSLESNKFTCKE